jgi:hypothetical protein
LQPVSCTERGEIDPLFGIIGGHTFHANIRTR